MVFPRLSSGGRAGRRQVSLWLPEEDWRVLDAIGRERDFGRGRLLALVLDAMGHSALAEAVVDDSMLGYRQGWARPVLSGKVPASRFGRMRLSVWLDERLARDVVVALRHERKRSGRAGGLLAISALSQHGWDGGGAGQDAGDAARRQPVSSTSE